MTKEATHFPVAFTAETFNELWDRVSALEKADHALSVLLGVAREDYHDHPVVGSPVHLRSNDGQGHTTCMPAICIQTDPENPDVISLVAFTRGGEGLGPLPAARLTDVPKGVSDHRSWHWPDDAEAHAWRPPRKTEE